MKNISDSEWKVMRVVWSKSPILASEIIEEVIKDTEWNPKTIHTLIRRLVKKGVLRAEKEKTYYSYYPAVSKEECVQEETKTFLEKCFGGSFNVMLSNFIKGDRLSDDEINELEKLLENKKSR
ncbi:BlaI/MecI/CopY family transcriptional regulator [Clostridium felsineum]|uniref:BlaI/MecI/CopY family transcriptional regulator n=1 Tax=Clostridium felsineum TaxID=36839 RepID=UPI00098BD829|nr:BlaI/MecI/CopY family transcriptional regulator [Clostridium felsineum]URZ14645.1 Penicillinase repressor [Clostridium felsineum DSM 794]